jgi:glycerol-3-phosphate dehydrogenase
MRHGFPITRVIPGDPDDLGKAFGATLTAAELRWLMTREFAQTAQDVVWRRSKLGLRLTDAEIGIIGTFMAADRNRSAAEASALRGE